MDSDVLRYDFFGVRSDPANPTKDLGIRSKAFSIYFGIDPKN